MGKSTLNGPFSTAILVYQRVHFKTILLVGVPAPPTPPPEFQGDPISNIQCIMKHDMEGHFTIQNLFLPHSYHIYHISPYITIKLPYIVPYITILLPFILPYIPICIPICIPIYYIQ